MRARETRAERWFRCFAKETTPPRSKPQRGCWRNILPTIAALRYPASLQFGRTCSSIIRRQLACGRYSSSSRLSCPLLEQRAGAEVAAEGLAASAAAAAEAAGLPATGRV